jgi:hypothetical protein
MRAHGIAFGLLTSIFSVACGSDDVSDGASDASAGEGGASGGKGGNGGSDAASGGTGPGGGAGAGGAAGAGGSGGALPPPCSHYASATGSGDGLSPSTPFKVQSFWALAKPGYTLCLADGVYRGADSMIAPPSSFDGTKCATLFGGTQGSPITVRAENDGAVEIDGEGQRVPMSLGCSTWLVVDGVDAHSSSGTVVGISRSENVLVRRVVAWDARDENTDVLGVHYGKDNVLEDVGAFGVARKTMSCSQGGDYCVCRRCWLRWEGSTNVGPKMALSMWYNSVGQRAENVIATWDNGSMPDLYTTQNNGDPWTGNFAGQKTGGATDQAYGLFSRDANTSITTAGAKIFGSIGYLRGKHRYDPQALFFLNGEDDVDVHNSAAFAEPGSHDAKIPFWLYGPANGSAGTGLVATDLSSVGATADTITTEWAKTDAEHAGTAAALGDSIYTGNGARICFEYVDGVETTTPLWPWRMNARILAATQRAADAGHSHEIYLGDPAKLTSVVDPHAVEDVTAAVEAMFGPIPATCKRP